MSNSPSTPGSRPLELLKVAELKDELKQRGLSTKGVKKELLERLEEAVKEEDQGLGHEEHAVTQEGALTEDAKEEAEVLDKTNASDTHDISDVGLSSNTVSSCPSNSPPPSDPSDVLPTGSLPTTTNEATPVCETLVSSGVSAPDGVPGLIEDREQLSAAGAASIGTNNDVLFVDNAVCENGDALLLRETVTSVPDMPKPGKEISGNHESRPDIAHPDSKAFENSDGALDGLTMSVNKDIASNEMNVCIDDGGLHASACNAVLANDASRTHHEAQDVEMTADSAVVADQVSKSETLIQVSSQAKGSPLETDHKASLEPMLQSNFCMDESLEEKDVCNVKAVVLGEPLQNDSEASADFRLEGLKIPIGDERDMIVTKEKSNAKMEIDTMPEEKHELVQEGIIEKSDVKMDPIDTDADLEGRRMLSNADIKEMQIDEGGPSQLTSLMKEERLNEVKVEKSSGGVAGESRGEKSKTVPSDSKSIASDNPDLKDDSQGSTDLKRKGAEADAKQQQEPAKRMRRWNSGKEMSVGAPKPLTTDSVNKITSPERTQVSFVAAQRSTPKPMSASREVPAKLKVQHDNGNVQTVPPSARAPSNSLKIERFVRPFTLKAVKDLLGKFGQCVDFWMDQIKTHCFVTFASVNEAVAARNGLYGRQWPPSVGNFLVAEYVDASEVKIRLEGLAEKAPAAQSTGLLLRNANGPPALPPRVAQPAAPSFRSSSNSLPLSRFYREPQQRPPAPRKDPEPVGLTLEDLFFKTTAKPSIYYLPLTDEQVAGKLAAANNKNRQAMSR